MALKGSNLGGATVTRTVPPRLPGSWQGALLAVLLVPVLWVTVWTFSEAFVEATVGGGLWRTPQFWYFHLGILLWLVAFFGLRRPGLVRLYVFGHEWTHALVAILCGGKILQWPRITSRGGHVVTSKTNLLISLSPYIVPFYGVGVALVFLAWRAVADPGTVGEQVFCAALGATWGFHLTFTLWMMWNTQPDLERNGKFLSMVFIFLANVLGVVILLVLAAPTVDPQAFAGRWWQHWVTAWNAVFRR